MNAGTSGWTWSPSHGCLRTAHYPAVAVDARDVPVDALLRWVRSVVPTAGEPRSVRARPWSVSVLLPSDDGLLWAKAAAAGLAHEGPLLAALAAAGHGTSLVPLVAHQPDRGFLLTRDGGSTLLQTAVPAAEQWRLVVGSHDRLLQDLAPLVGTALALGVPDLRGERLVGHWASVVHAAADEGLGAHALTASERRAALAVGPSLQQAAAVHDHGTVDHGDAHPGNLLSAGHRFLDLGDATVVDADLALTNTFRRAARELGGEVLGAARSSGPAVDALAAVLRSSVWLRLPRTARHAWPQHLPAAVRDAVQAFTR